MEKKAISRAVINRLPRYYRFLKELEKEGTERISSLELSKALDVTASQIRQDFNNFGGFGQQGYGYNVPYLREEIGKILGLDNTYNMIIVGVGNLGRALANYPGFGNNGYRIIGLFDVDEAKTGDEINGNVIRSMDEIEEFIESEKVDIAVISVPHSEARDTANNLAKKGIKAFMNFTQADLEHELPDSIFVQNVYLVDSIMLLSYDLKNNTQN